MSKSVLDRLKAVFKERILETNDFRGDEEARVAPEDWLQIATFLRDDAETEMNFYTDLTAVDYLEREPKEPRFDVILMVRSLAKNHRIRIKTRVGVDQELDSLVSVWRGADWSEREVYDMFGIRFKNHPDLRRILLYDEFEGYPLRKDYPIEKTQPLVPYRDVEGIEIVPPFGPDEGKPWNRIDWLERTNGRDLHVSPSLGIQQGQRSCLSQLDERNSGEE
ncbi:MAG: NADH-quinone oxidoreductase subunit C [Deltaproteobacteria bacterium]|nr:NADH-quinone oxidoreductase subunit C [Deltaproteobacteria bacterium]